jgi:hypothetical protein
MKNLATLRLLGYSVASVCLIHLSIFIFGKMAHGGAFCTCYGIGILKHFINVCKVFCLPINYAKQPVNEDLCTDFWP